MKIDPEYNMIIQADVGEEVWDDLTRSKAKIVRIERDEHGNVGIWLDNDYLGGGRHPWEIGPPPTGTTP